MITPNIQPPLTELQAEMLKLFATKISEKDLIEIRNIIARCLFEKARDEADSIWDQRNYTNEKLNTIISK